jgi:hypothetical protein
MQGEPSNNQNCDSDSNTDEGMKLKRNRPSNLKYQKISNMVRINVIYSKKVLQMNFRTISTELNVNYNSVRNILKVHEDGEAQVITYLNQK